VALLGLAGVVAVGIVLLRDPGGPEATPTPAAAVSVPNIVGMSEGQARQTVERVGLDYGQPVYVALPDRPEGTVVDQAPQPGTSVPGGSSVEAVVSTARELVVVPDVRGLPEAEAVVALTTSGLRIDEVNEAGDATVGAGQAAGTEPVAGSRLPEGSAVTLIVASDPELSSPPSPTGSPSGS
jgi:serine/threonine-protein kinase